MKVLIAYALVITGIPILVGYAFGLILSMPVSLIVGLSRRGRETPFQAAEAAAKEPVAWVSGATPRMAVRDLIAHACLDTPSGFGAILAAGLLVHSFGLSPGAAVLLIVAAWEIFFTLKYGQSFRALFSSLAGMVVGWFVILRFLSL
jgi:hypothetical protein